jgi:uncharacterized protein
MSWEMGNGLPQVLKKAFELFSSVVDMRKQTHIIVLVLCTGKAIMLSVT